MTPVEKLAAQVRALPLDQKLQLAAMAVREGRRDLALTFVENARMDLLAEKLFGATTHANATPQQRAEKRTNKGEPMTAYKTPEQVQAAYEWIVSQIDNRLQCFSDAGVRLAPRIGGAQQIKYVLQQSAATKEAIAQFIGDALSGYPTNPTPSGASHNAAVTAFNDAHGDVLTRMKDNFIPPPGHSTGTAGAPISEIKSGANADNAKRGEAFLGVDGKVVRLAPGDTPGYPGAAYVAARDLLFKTYPYTAPVPPGPDAPPATGGGGTLKPGGGIA
jgi:hypothetical protein